MEARYPRPARRQRRPRRPPIWLLAAALALYVLGLVLLEISPVRIWTGLGQLGTIIVLMLPPSTGGHFALYLEALGQTLSIAFLGTLLAADPRRAVRLPRRPQRRRQPRHARPGPPQPRHRPQHRRADLGADLDQRRRPRPLRRRPGHRLLRLRRARQADVRGDRDRRPQAGRRRARQRRRQAGRRSASASSPRSCRSSPASCSTSSNRTPARPPSSASSAPAASACTSTSRSACWSGSRSPS